MIKLRLKRFGKKKEASFRIVACNSTTRRDGRPLQELGFYNPRTKETRLDTEALRLRLNQGAQPTNVVRTLLEKGGLLNKKERSSIAIGKAKLAEREKAANNEAKKSYNKMFFSYLKTFNRLGLKAIPMAADTGPIGGDLSHEFIILAETGESQIYADKKIFEIDLNKYVFEDSSLAQMRKDFTDVYAVTDEKYNEKKFNESVDKKDQIKTKGIEVGHIFYFGDKYSKPMSCTIDDKSGKKISVKMGSYGIGVSRLVGAIIEAKYNNNVMKWPKSVSPFDVAIIPSFNKNNKENLIKAKKIYHDLKKQNIDVLLDDVDENMSNKFKKHDLIGIPYQIIIGSKSEGDRFEFKELNSESSILSLEDIKSKLKNWYLVYKNWKINIIKKS